ncbi:MAG: DUF945 family protein [Gammaproteobacteria bacterium]
MNRIVAAVVALIVVLLLAIPPALGTLTESRVRERVAAINDTGMFAAEVKSFDRGWFRSTAKIDIGLSPGYIAQVAASGAPADVLGPHATIAVDFAHGPVAVQKGVHFGWSTMVARLDPATAGLGEIEQQLGVPYIFEFRGHTGFGGGVAFDADVPPMDVPTGIAQFKFSGAVLDGSYAGNHLVSNTRIDSFEFASPGGTFVLHSLRAKTDNEILSLYLAPGTAELSIDSVSAIDPVQGSTPVLQADKLKLTSTVTRGKSATLVDMQAQYGLDKLHVAENEVTGAVLGLALHNVDVEAIQHFRGTARDAALNPAPDAEAAVATATADLQRVLAAGPSLVLDPIRFAWDGEPFEGRAELSTDPTKLPPGGITDVASAVLSGALSSNADVKLSKPLARRLVAFVAEMQFRGDARMPPEQLKYMAEAQAGLMLAQLVGQGFVIEDGEVYRAALRYVDGALTVNDKPLPFGP